MDALQKSLVCAFRNFLGQKDIREPYNFGKSEVNTLSLSLHDSGTNEGAIKVMREIVTEFDINKPTMSATYLFYFKCQWEI
jgi:hypothetical protein